MKIKIPFLLPYDVPISEDDEILFDNNIVSFDTYVQKNYTSENRIIKSS